MKQKGLSLSEDYQRRVNLVTDYVRTHLQEDISIDTLSQISAFSPFHFQRVISACLGESIGTFIQRTRIERAAKLLTNSKMRVSEIAYEVGYDSPSSLTKMFVRLYAVSPTKYRKTKIAETMETHAENIQIDFALKPKIVDVPTKTVIYINAAGDYKTLDYSSRIERLWQEVKTQKLYSAGVETLVFYNNDPCVTEPEHLSCDICIAIHKPAVPNGEIGVKSVAGGKFAEFTYVGPYSNLTHVYDKIYREWFPESGHQMGNRPCFEKYVNDPRKVEPEKFKTVIYIAIE